jgi:hypothetical protein
VVALALRFVISRVSFKRSPNPGIQQQAEWGVPTAAAASVYASVPLEKLDVMDKDDAQPCDG